MACRLFGAKHLPEPMQNVSIIKYIKKISAAKMAATFLGPPLIYNSFTVIYWTVKQSGKICLEGFHESTRKWHHINHNICFSLIIIVKHTYLKALNISNAYQAYSVECVSKIKFYFVHNGAVYFQHIYFSFGDHGNICTIWYDYHQIKIWITKHCLRLSHETMCVLYVLLWSYKTKQNNAIL